MLSFIKSSYLSKKRLMLFNVYLCVHMHVVIFGVGGVIKCFSCNRGRNK